MIGINVAGALLNLAVVVWINSKQGKDLVKNKIVRGAITLGGIGAGAFLGYRAGKEINEKIKARQWTNVQVPGNITTVPVDPGAGTGTPGQLPPGGATVDLKLVAGQIYDAFYNNDWFGWSEDEEGAIEALATVPTTYAQQLAQVYNTLHGEILKADFIRFLSSEQLKRVEPWLKVM